MRLSELLRRQAEQTLADMIFHLFSRLPSYDTEHADDPVGETRLIDSPIRTQLHRTSFSLGPGERQNIAAAVAAGDQEATVPVSAAEAASRAAARLAASPGDPIEGPATPVGEVVFIGDADRSIDMHEPAQPAQDATAKPPNSTAAAASERQPATGSASVQQQQQQQQHTNARGVRFTPGQDDDNVNLVRDHSAHCLFVAGPRLAPIASHFRPTSIPPQTPYGTPCVAELLRFLISLINPNDRQNMPTQISMGLNMLVIAMETGAPHLQLYPTLMEVR